MWGRILSAVAIIGFHYYLDFAKRYNFGAFTKFSNSQIGEGFERNTEGAGAVFSLEAAIIFLLFVFFYVFLNRNSFELIKSKKAHAILRIGSFLIDFAILVPLVIFLDIILVLSIEAISTGNFEWSFIRAARDPRDFIFEITVGFGKFFLFYYYFYWHLKQQMPTIGQHIFGFKISHKKPFTTFDCLVYLFSATMHLPLFPIVFYKAIVRNVAWWDRKTEVDAVTIKVSNTIFRTPW